MHLIAFSHHFIPHSIFYYSKIKNNKWMGHQIGSDVPLGYFKIFFFLSILMWHEPSMHINTQKTIDARNFLFRRNIILFIIIQTMTWFVFYYSSHLSCISESDKNIVIIKYKKKKQIKTSHFCCRRSSSRTCNILSVARKNMRHNIG